MRRLVFRVFFVLIIIFCLLTLSLWGLSPYVSRVLLRDYFAAQGATFSAESLAFNPFTVAVSARGVSVTTDKGREFELQAMDIGVRLLPLLKKTLEVEQATLSGMLLNIDQQADGWRLAGVLIPNPQGKQPPPPARTDSAPSLWQVDLPKLQLRDCSLNLNRLPGQGSAAGSGQALRDRIDIASLDITDLRGNGSVWSGDAELKAQLNGADIELSSQFDVTPDHLRQQVDIHFLRARLQQFSHYLPPRLLGSEASLEFAGELALALRDGDLTLAASGPTLDVAAVALVLDDYAINGNSLNLELGSVQISIPREGSPTVELEAELRSRGVSINRGEDVLLAGWEQLEVAPLSLQLGAELAANVGRIESQNLLLSRVAQSGDQLPPLLRAGSLTVTGLTIAGATTRIEQLALVDAESEVRLDPQRRLITLVPFPAPAGAESGAVAAKPPAPQPSASQAQAAPQVLIIDRIAVSGDSRLEFTDAGVKPLFRQRIQINSLVAEDFNTGSPQQALRVQLQAQTDKYAKIVSETQIWPFADKLSLQTKADFSELNLPPVSPYLRDALGYEIASGQFDMTLKMNIEAGEISGDSNILLRGVDLGAAQEEERNLAKDTSTIPLNAAVGMLKDGDGNVKLNVPLTGDLANPSFGWSGFVALIVKKAVFEATSSYLIKTFVPYANVVSVVKFAGEQALKIRVAPLPYEPGQTDISPEQQEFVDEFRKLLQDKEDIQVKTCPVAAPVELGLAQGTKLTAEHLSALKSMAQQRGQKFKEAVLHDSGVASARILLCNPEIARGEGETPRIEFSI